MTYNQTFTSTAISNIVRSPAVAGLFYPGEKTALTRELTHLQSRVKRQHIDGTVVGLIAPHAGYEYSGLTATHAYAQVQGYGFDTIVIVSPSHHEYFDGISVYNGKGYSTPLGVVNVNEEMRERLIGMDPFIHASSMGHSVEHALEVQLPFIQTFFAGTTILPVVMGDQRRRYCYHLGEKLAEILRGTRSLLVASTDLSHYHGYEEANTLDRSIIDAVRDFNGEQLMDDLEAGRVEACGGGPMVAVMAAAKNLGADKINILHHCNSGDITGDRDRVVGYLAAAVVRTH